ncbi:MAG TPA: Gmad2 immunoglobulin-like domain-containing protein [Marmoricola sp.]|nr:Gmad2 immunoglobulin-like domain-containing protein [Marmoricola sp.]
MTDRTPEGRSSDDELRHLLDDAVSDVDPAPALSAIRNRTKVTPMNRHRSWLVAAAAAVAVGAATVTTVALTGDDGARPDRAGPVATPDATPDGDGNGNGDSATTSPEPTESGAPEVAQAVPVYYVGETPAGPRLFREFHRMTVPDDPAATAKAALVEALSSSALDPDYHSPWAGLDLTVGLVTQAGDTIVVDLGGGEGYGGSLRERPLGMSRAEADMAVEQLIHTVQAVYQEAAPVQLLLHGDHIDTLLGVPVAEPLAAGDPMQVQGTVWIIDPQDGDEVTSPFTVEGRGAFFEANVSWQLLDGDRVVDEGFAMAEECCTLSPYSFEVEAAPGDYVLRVYDADMSGGEGGGEAEDTKRITVR